MRAFLDSILAFKSAAFRTWNRSHASHRVLADLASFFFVCWDFNVKETGLYIVALEGKSTTLQLGDQGLLESSED